MIKLHGFTISNYFNMVKMAMLEKGIAFEHVDVKPSQDADFLAVSPMGKVPCIETDAGFLSETDVIFDYLEELNTGASLLPESAFERAKVREIIKEIELYVELPARSCFAEAFFGGTVSDETKEKAKASLAKGMSCLKRNVKFGPYAAGSTFSYADIMFLYSVPIANACSKKVLGTDLLADFPEAAALLALLGERETAKQVAADQRA